MAQEKVTASSLIIDALEAHPKVKDLLLAHGLPCYRCWVAEVETIDVGARSEGLDGEAIVEEINQLLGVTP